MSIMDMAEAKVIGQIRDEEAQAPPPPGAPPGAPPSTPSPVGVPVNVVNQLTTWIPTESITLYVAYIALFNPVVPRPGVPVCANNFAPRWMGFWVFVALTSLIAFGGYMGKRRAAIPVPPFKLPIFAMVAAPVAFATWAAALPDSPFRDICGYSSTIGGFAVLVAAVGISFVAWMLGKAPDYVRAEASPAVRSS